MTAKRDGIGYYSSVSEQKMNFRVISLVLILVMMTAVFSLSCNSSVYSGPSVTRELPSAGWETTRTTIPELESILQTKMEIPSYLPYGYAIQEAYYSDKIVDNIQTYRIIFLISDQPIKWEGNQYECQVVLEIGWNEFGAGLKMDWAKYIESIGGRLENEDDKYILWWESVGSYGPGHSTSRLYASNQFPKNELIHIAESTFSSNPE